MESHHTLSQWVGNVLSAGVILGSFLGWLPLLGAGVAMVWYTIQIFESDTVRAWLARRKIRRIARLKAKLLMLESHVAPLPPGMEDRL